MPDEQTREVVLDKIDWIFWIWKGRYLRARCSFPAGQAPIGSKVKNGAKAAFRRDFTDCTDGEARAKTRLGLCFSFSIRVIL